MDKLSTTVSFARVVRERDCRYLAEHLQNGSSTAEEFASASGIERSMAFRFLRACTKIGLITCDDGRTFKSTSRLQPLHGETPNSMWNKRSRQCYQNTTFLAQL